jgi:peptidoglycan hydrolase-like protein with peptidoglycan-binding domain
MEDSMEMALLIKLLPIVFRAINVAPQIQEAMRIGTPILKAVEENAGDLLPLLKEIGKEKFPDIDEKFAPAAAASTMFDPIRIKWLQTALNVLGANPSLDVDGEYGPMTQDAVLQFQKAHDLVADGWAGDTTHAAMQLALAEKPKLATQRAAAAG